MMYRSSNIFLLIPMYRMLFRNKLFRHHYMPSFTRKSVKVSRIISTSSTLRIRKKKSQRIQSTTTMIPCEIDRHTSSILPYCRIPTFQRDPSYVLRIVKSVVEVLVTESTIFFAKMGGLCRSLCMISMSVLFV